MADQFLVTGPALQPPGLHDGPIRVTTDGAQAVADVRGKYADATARGRVFSIMTALAGTTIVAANNSPVAAAAASILSLHNPLGTGVNLEILKAWLLFISGTPGAGAFVWNMAWNQTITATQNNVGVAGGAPVGNFVSGVGSVAKAFTQTALTGSTAQVPLRPIGASFAAAIAASSPQDIVDLCDGDIVVPPGGLISIASPATGTTCIVAAGIQYQEVPV